MSVATPVAFGGIVAFALIFNTVSVDLAARWTGPHAHRAALAPTDWAHTCS